MSASRSRSTMRAELIAPCGMNCNLCSWVLDPSKPGCVGCRPRGRGCIHKKGLCARLARQEISSCHKCEDFPCQNLVAIDARYCQTHNYSFIENLLFIRTHGMPAFLRREVKRYTCPSCGLLLTIHGDKCPHCRHRHNRKDRRPPVTQTRAARRSDAMKGPLLRDEQEYPSDDVLAKCLGRAKSAWDALAIRLAKDHPDMSLEWRYYKDGKSWLCKLVRKKKTVCWVSIGDRTFQTTFYFTARNEGDIDRLPISQVLKDAIRAQPLVGKLKPATVRVRSEKQLGDVFTLIGYRSASR